MTDLRNVSVMHADMRGPFKQSAGTGISRCQPLRAQLGSAHRRGCGQACRKWTSRWQLLNTHAQAPSPRHKPPPDASCPWLASNRHLAGFWVGDGADVYMMYHCWYTRKCSIASLRGMARFGRFRRSRPRPPHRVGIAGFGFAAEIGTGKTTCRRNPNPERSCSWECAMATPISNNLMVATPRNMKTIDLQETFSPPTCRSSLGIRRYRATLGQNVEATPSKTTEAVHICLGVGAEFMGGTHGVGDRGLPCPRAPWPLPLPPCQPGLPHPASIPRTTP